MTVYQHGRQQFKMDTIFQVLYTHEDVDAMAESAAVRQLNPKKHTKQF